MKYINIDNKFFNIDFCHIIINEYNLLVFILNEIIFIIIILHILFFN